MSLEMLVGTDTSGRAQGVSGRLYLSQGYPQLPLDTGSSALQVNVAVGSLHPNESEHLPGPPPIPHVQ